jgi:hypothetical protein
MGIKKSTSGVFGFPVQEGSGDMRKKDITRATDRDERRAGEIGRDRE